MRDHFTVIDIHFDFSRKLEQLLRDHDHVAAAVTARAMIEIAETASAEMRRQIRKSQLMPCHRGYDYMTDKGYMVGVCEANEAIRLCEKAAKEGWFGLWKATMAGIKAHEKELAMVKSVIRITPDIVQAELLKQYPEVDSQTLYYADIRGEIIRIKKGRSYVLRLPD